MLHLTGHFPVLLNTLVVMIHWTDQLKELLNDQEIVDDGVNCGPLEEIAFWESRSNKLSEVCKQLQTPEVKHIRDIALLVKSVYVESFCQLAKGVQVSKCFFGMEEH